MQQLRSSNSQRLPEGRAGLRGRSGPWKAECGLSAEKIARIRAAPRPIAGAHRMRICGRCPGAASRPRALLRFPADADIHAGPARG